MRIMRVHRWKRGSTNVHRWALQSTRLDHLAPPVSLSRDRQPSHSCGWLTSARLSPIRKTVLSPAATRERGAPRVGIAWSRGPGVGAPPAGPHHPYTLLWARVHAPGLRPSSSSHLTSPSKKESNGRGREARRRRAKACRRRHPHPHLPPSPSPLAVGGGRRPESMAMAEEKRVGEARAPLAVEALRGKIVEKVKGNRVTLIVGDTGCGNRAALSLSLSLSRFDPIRLAPVVGGGLGGRFSRLVMGAHFCRIFFCFIGEKLVLGSFIYVFLSPHGFSGLW